MNAAPSQRLVWTLRLLCSVAFGVSAYLTWVAANQTGPAGCGGSVFDCDHVLTSPWSKVATIPVATTALGLYSVALAALAFCGNRVHPSQRQVGWRLFTACGLAAGLAAVWFISLQVLVIKHFCSYCLAAHSCGLLISAALLWKHPIGAASTMRHSLLSAAGVAVLIGAQVWMPAPPPKVVEEFHKPVDHIAARIPSDLAESEVFEAPGGDLFESPGDDVFEAPAFEDDVFEAPTFEDDAEYDNSYAPAETD